MPKETPLSLMSPSARTHELLVLSATTAANLDSATVRLARHCAAQPELRLADVAFTLQTANQAGGLAGGGPFDHRRMVVASDPADAASALSDPRGARVFTAEQSRRNRPVAFMFPGVGDHYPGIARDLYRSEPVFRAAFDRCAEIIQINCGEDPRDLLSDGSGPARAANRGTGKPDFRAMVGRSGRGSASSPFKETRLAQPLVYAVSYALSELLASFDIKPVAVIGYSVGEYVAATVTGVLSMDDALELVCKRAALIQAQPRGAMMAVALSEYDMIERLPADLDLAVVNGDQAVVVAGPLEPVRALETQLHSQDIACRILDTSHAFHSREMNAAAPALSELVGGYTPRYPRIPVVSNLTGDWIDGAQMSDPEYWARHMCGTVQFSRGLEKLLDLPDAVLVEVGPGQTLGSYAKQHARTGKDRIGSIVSTLPSVHARVSDLAFFQATLGRLWLEGVDVNFASARGRETHCRIPLQIYSIESDLGSRESPQPADPATSGADAIRGSHDARAADRAQRRQKRLGALGRAD